MALAAEMQNFYADPLGYVMFNFPWGTDPSIQIVKLESDYQDRYDCEYGPDRWACEFLDQLGDEIYERGFNGKTAVDPIQFATVSEPTAAACFGGATKVTCAQLPCTATFSPASVYSGSAGHASGSSSRRS